MNWLLSTSLMLVTSRLCDSSYNILALTPQVGNASQSHFHILERLSELLISRGHQVTMPLHEHMSSKSQLIEVVKTPSSQSAEEWENTVQSFMKELVYNNLTFTQMKTMIINQVKECDSLLNDKHTYRFLKSKKFDFALVDQFFNCGFLYAARLGLPVIGLECGSNLGAIMDLNDPFALAYNPVPMTGFPQMMSFYERSMNMAHYWLNRLVGPIFMRQQHQKVQAKHGLGGEDIAQLKADVLLWISNQGWVIDYARPIMPNVIQTPGMLTAPPKPLLPEYRALYDKAGKDGVIVVSFGSYITLEGLMIEQQLMEGFRHLRQQVIYRADHEVPHKPDNVHVFPYIPQNDLLGQPRTRACILHGGLNGVYEAIYNAVPMLIVPAMFDAMDNARRVEEKGMGLYIDATKLTGQEVYRLLMKLITEKRYRRSISRFSAILKDTPQLPLEKAAFWVEHVMRHGTEGYLRDVGKDFHFLSRHLLDVVGVWLVVLLATLYLILHACSRCLKAVARATKKKTD